MTREDGAPAVTLPWLYLLSFYLFSSSVFFMIQFTSFVMTLTSPYPPITAALVYLLGGSVF